MLEAGAVQGAQMLLFLEKPHDVEQQVVKVHAIGFLLAGHVLFMHVQDGVQVVGEVRIGVFQRFLDIGALIVRQAEQGGKDFRFGEAGGFLIQFEGLDHAFNHGFAVVGIHDRESRSIAQVFRVLAQDAVGNGMKRAAPQAGQVQGNQGRTRSVISRAALLVKVSSRMFHGSVPWSRSHATR